MTKPLIIGHRGACGYEPENTLRSFRRAIELGADMIEFDVRQCRTGELVIIHDTLVNRTTNGQGFITDLAFDDLRKLDAGKGEQIPLLSEVLDVAQGKVKVNIEIVAPGITDDVMRLVQDYVDNHGWTLDDFLISSYFHPELVRTKKIIPDIRIGALLDGLPLSLAAYGTELKAYSVHVWKDYITHEFIDDAHQRGLKVFLHSVNYPEDIRQKLSWGVDALFTDFPDRF